MKKINLIMLCASVCIQCSAQKIIYSDFEKKDFDRFRFDVIAKHNDRILVYKATYFSSPFVIHNRQAPQLSYANPDQVPNMNNVISTASSNSILESAFSIYDLQMKIVKQIVLPLPKEISVVHFLVYDDYFYMFYQYQRVHTIYCTAAKIDMDGEMMGTPVEMDSTDIVDAHYETQIYSVIYSENKKYILALKTGINNNDGYILTNLLFDNNLHLVHKSVNKISIARLEYLKEFKIDNDGNFVFLGFSQANQQNDGARAALFILQDSSDKLLYNFVFPADLYTDDIRLSIDNVNKKYILTSLYSKKPGGNIRGLYCIIRDIYGNLGASVTNTVFTDSLEMQLGKDGSTVFNNYYLQNIHLLQNGGFVAEAMDLSIFPYSQSYDRWNYLQYFSEQIATNFIFFDPYEYYHYYPWMVWRHFGNNYNFSSSNTLIMSFNNRGVLEWINVLKTPQDDEFHATLGYKKCYCQ
ncbi:MAG TPA: hypothetical protein VK787_09895 [Puia sp.]|jgi:hypothetical protein|nr:hypothetical protein [Puia sp.]